MTHSATPSPAFALNTARGTFRVAVDGDAAAPSLVLSNSLGTTLDMWAPQVEAFAQSHRVVRYDTRGHGGSVVTPGPYTIADLGQDVLAILDALEVPRAAFCGVSMGGHTGLWLGMHAGDRLQALAVCNSAARIGTVQGWAERAAAVRQGGGQGMQALADSAPGRWFTPDFVRAHPDAVRAIQAVLAATNPEGYAACCEALAHSDLRQDLGRIAIRSLLIAGAFDPVTTVADAHAMQAAMAHAHTEVLQASHLSNLQAPQAFTSAVLQFLAGAPSV